MPAQSFRHFLEGGVRAGQLQNVAEFDVAFRTDRQLGASLEQGLHRDAARHDLTKLRQAFAAHLAHADMHVGDLYRDVARHRVVGFRTDQLAFLQDEIMHISAHRDDVVFFHGRIAFQIQNLAVADDAQDGGDRKIIGQLRYGAVDEAVMSDDEVAQNEGREARDQRARSTGNGMGRAAAELRLCQLGVSKRIIPEDARKISDQQDDPDGRQDIADRIGGRHVGPDLFNGHAVGRYIGPTGQRAFV